MPKVRIKANELVETDVNFVSLVKRGANRIPFRITKEDNEMLDLYKLGRSLFKKADPKPEIVAAILQKGANLEQVATIFKEAGLDPKDFVQSEKDGIVTVAKTDADKAEDTVVLTVSDDVALVVANVKKAFEGYAGTATDFGVVMATEGVYPSLCVANEALHKTIGNILFKASSPDEASAEVAKAIDAFKGYVTGVLGSVPVQAFKVDVEFAKLRAVKAAVEAEETQKADAGKNGTGAGFEEGKGTGVSAAATEDDRKNTVFGALPGESTTGNEDEGPVDARKADTGLPDPKGHEPGDPGGFAAAPADTARATAAATQDDKKMNQNGGVDGSSIPDGDSGLNRLGGVRKEEIEALMKALGDLKQIVETSVSEVRKEVGALNTRIEQVDQRVQKAEADLSGTIYNEAGGDTFRAKKSDGGHNSIPPLLDTAYDRNV